MSTGNAATQHGPSPAEVADEVSLWLVGGGVVTFALFPFAIPFLLLTAVFAAPLVVLPVLAALPVAVLAGLVLAIRAIGRRLGRRRRSFAGSRTRSPSRSAG